MLSRHRTIAPALVSAPIAALVTLLCLGDVHATDASASFGESPSTARSQSPAIDSPPPSGAQAEDDLELWYFYRDECPHCQRADPWLEELEAAHEALVVNRVSVDDPAGADRLVAMMRARDQRATAVPTFIVDEEVWTGFSPRLAEVIEGQVAARIAGLEVPESGPDRLDLGPLGSVEIADRSLLVATLLIAFVDGFNPCSLWVLTVLLAMILATRSRARIAAVGLTFLFVTTLLYGLFIVGLFTALVVTSHLGWIQVAVALLAVGFGAVNVKDFFAYKKGISFTIPDRFKPKIYRGGRAVRKERPLLVTLAMTVALAGGVALVELPCTAGFPVVWTSMVSDAGTGTSLFAALLAAYLLVYLSVEIAILIGALVTMRASRMQEKHGRTLKLFGGMVMVALGVVLLVDRTIMEQITGSIAVIAAALAASLVVQLGSTWWARRKRGPKGGKSRRGL